MELLGTVPAEVIANDRLKRIDRHFGAFAVTVDCRFGETLYHLSRTTTHGGEEIKIISSEFQLQHIVDDIVANPSEADLHFIQPDTFERDEIAEDS